MATPRRAVLSGSSLFAILCALSVALLYCSTSLFEFQRGYGKIFWSPKRTSMVVIFSAYHYLHHVMRKPALCICESKAADQLRGSNEGKFKPLASFCCSHSTACFVSELVRNPEDRFSLDVAHLLSMIRL